MADQNIDGLAAIQEAVQLQKRYRTLEQTGRLSKRAMCQICIPFRDKYDLTDLQTLRIARAEVDTEELLAIFGL